jgi:hypothetical protein
LLEDAMSLRKSPTRTPALLEANRRNARKSTGPRTARGKAQTRMNALRTGERSRICRSLLLAFLYAPPGWVEQWASNLLTPEMALHPVIRKEAEIAIQAEREVGDLFHQLHIRRERE